MAGCTPADRSPEAIRHDTAKATTTAVRDAKAVAKGVADGLKAKGSVNINTASADDLESLPGIDAIAAHKIIAGRPYSDSDQLVKRRLVSKPEYDRISSQIVAQ